MATTDGNGKEKLSDQISRTIQMDILAGVYPPDTRLPSERDLARQFNVSRVTVREAIERLLQLGMVEKRPHSGTYARDVSTNSSILLLTDLMNNGESVEPDVLIALMEFRSLVEVYAVQKAASMARADDISLLRSILVRMKQTIAVPADISPLNLELHALLNRLSGNLVIQLLFNSFKPVYHYYMDFFHRLPGASADIVPRYEKILVAIEQKDGQYAAHLMTELLRAGHNRVKEAAAFSADGKKVRLR
jgi:GntR family transcriptional repressor for pyruvate dehydrogenase complex